MLVEVALPLPVPHTFTYRVEGWEEVAEGTRVLVPFGRRRLIGWVVGPGTPSIDLARVRSVSQIFDEEPGLTPELLRLCRWVADYFIAPLGQVIRTALPVVLTDTSRPEPAVRTERILRIVRELPTLQQREDLFGRAPRQRECYELVELLGGRASTAHLVGQVGFSHSVLRGLVEKGIAEIVEEVVERDPFAEVEVSPPQPLELTAAQSSAVEKLTRAAQGGGGQTFLLHGVTGSGKTQVYIELLKEVVERQGRGAIILVPEIALTPQTVARFRSHFGSTVAVLHSALSDGERYDAWLSLRRGERKIAVGARSAVFAPVADLGAIIVDEEHEATYKQSEAPRYHARDVAIVRARLAGALCLLGSATPSLESWMNAQRGKSTLLTLPARVEGRPLPPVRVVDLQEEREAQRGKGTPIGSKPEGPPVLTGPLIEAIEDRLRRGEQTILLLNRRGYSNYILCWDCREVWECPQCNVSMTYHRARRRIVCHYCFREEPAPLRCDNCGSSDLSFRGAGTEQVERIVGETFPTARIARMDIDTTSARWAHHEILGRVERGEVDLLLGTQMIAKGLDFPNVTLVGVINADVGIHLPDFRAAERTFQLLTQVAGRAGRGPKGGEVLVQTAIPENYVIRAAQAHDYLSFVEQELEERGGPGYPPHRRMANVLISGRENEAVETAAEEVAEWTRGYLARAGLAEEVTLIGPATSPIGRIRGRWRRHFLLRSGRARALGEVLWALFEGAPLKPGRADLRLVLDRDPVSLL